MTVENRPRTPFMLMLACILSMLASIGGMIYGLTLPQLLDMDKSVFEEAFKQMGLVATSEMTAAIYSLCEMGYYYFAFNVLELIGVFIMMRGLRMGIHVYAASQLGLIGIMVIAMGFGGSITYMMWAAVWCLVYIRLFAHYYGSPSDDAASDR